MNRRLKRGIKYSRSSKCDCGRWLRHNGQHENIKCNFCGKYPDVFNPHRQHKKLKSFRDMPKQKLSQKTQSSADEKKRIGKEFKRWFYSKGGETIEDAIKRITGVRINQK